MNSEKIKKLNRIFNPKNIAIVGASDKEGSVGYGLVKNIQDGNNTRTVFLINPFIKEIFGTKTYSDITKVKELIDLVVVAVPAPIVLEIVRQCVKVKAGGIIIIASGFGESGEEGKGLEKNIVETCVKAGIPLIGPNCLGIMNTSEQLNASFAPLDPRKGNIAFLSQSGAMVDAVLDRCANDNFGFSKIVSYGNEADCGLIDFLEYLKTDKQTKAIIVYFEGVADGRGFMEMARAVSKIKPIIAIKAGRGEGGQKAASTHTGSLSTGYEVYRAALKQSGVIQVDSLDALLDSARAFSFQNRINNGIGIITNGGGLGVLAVDACEEAGVLLPSLSEKTIRALEKNKVMEKIKIKRNPLDVIGDALPDRYEAGIRALLEQENIFGVLVLQGMQIMTQPLENAKIIVELKNKFPDKTIITCFAGEKLADTAIKYLESNNIPNYTDPKRAVKVLNSLIIK